MHLKNKKVFSTVTESDANINATTSLFPNAKNFPCSGHRLNASINDLFKIKKIIEKQGKYYIYTNINSTEVCKIEISGEDTIKMAKLNEVKDSLNDLLIKCRHLVGLFRHSEGLINRLAEKQEFLNSKFKGKLIQDFKTRWDTSYDMIESIYLNKDALISMSNESINKSIKSFIPNSDEFKFIEELCLLLRPLKQLTCILSVKSYISSSIIYPSIYNLVNTNLVSLNLKNKSVILLRDELVASIRKHFSYIFDDDFFLVTTFLDFRFKNLEFIEENSRFFHLERIKIYLSNFYCSRYENKSSIDLLNSENSNENLSQINNNNNNNNSSYFSVDGSESFLDNLIDKSVVTNPLIDLDQEIDNYLKERPAFDGELVKKFGPIIFYRNFHFKFPILTRISKTFFTVTATSVPAEILLSQNDLIQDQFKNRPDIDNLEMLTLIKYNC